jgi:hypothetical protein
MPCCAKVLLSSVDSITPGNFLALNTWKGFVKTDARTGAEVVLSEALGGAPTELPDAGVVGEVGFEALLLLALLLPWPLDRPTLTKLNLSLPRRCQICLVPLLFTAHWACLPEYAIGADTEVLKDKPDTKFVILVMQSESARTQRPDQVASEHASWLVGRTQRLLLVGELNGDCQKDSLFQGGNLRTR